ncbi:MAG: TetR/AcrR family transcriptional regulator [Rhodobacteraceae bacterium]|nr:TetR/AcrR family transcriptional regulator [Paracoccaceae bacterium]
MARTTGSHSDITGPRIRDAARALFAKHGYAAVSMRQIAKDVGVQAGALYNYIPDKQTLLLDLMRDHMEQLLADVPKAVEQGTPMERLEAFVRFHIAYNYDHPDAVFIAYMELRNLEPANFELIETLRSRYERHLEAILQDGVREGAMTVGEPRVVTFTLIAMLNGVNTWFREGGRLSLAEVQDLNWSMVRRAVGVE